MSANSPAQPDGYLALPPTGSGPAVLVLHAWWGLNDTIRAFCRRLAEAGFVAFAPDLYHGKVVVTVAEAEALSNALDADRARADLAEAVRLLGERTGQADAGVAVVGFSLGAFFALELSARAPARIRAVVTFYGTRPGDYRGSRAAYLCHFAENDPFEPESAVVAMETALRNAGRPATFRCYAGTGHWFFEPDRPDAFNAEAANLAWERTAEFLREET